MTSASPSIGSNSNSPPASTSANAPSSPGRSRQTRIHFPADTDSPLLKAASPSNPTVTGLSSLEPSVGRHQALSIPGSSPDDDVFAERRRVRSTNASDRSRPSGSFSRAQFVAGSNRTRTTAKRAVSYSHESSDRSHTRGSTSIGSSPLSGGILLPSEGGAEQGDDPNILADLRKALQYKPRIEQHLKEVRSLSDFPSSSLPSPPNVSPLDMSPKPFVMKAPLPHSDPNTPVKAEFVDFSPSVGKSSLHPVPTSTDDGATLDWSGSTSEEEKHERKWTVSLSRRSSKEKYPMLSRKALVEKQDTLYSDKLAKIKDKANSLTMRKAEITKDQLQRRYATLNTSYASSNSHLNLVKVAHWFNKQESITKSLIVESEPMPWLRHLLAKHGKSQKEQRAPSRWNLSAMIVDEYMRSNSDAEFILYANTPVGDGVSDAGSSVSATRLRRPVSRPTSFRSIDGVSVQRNSDDLISFEPMVHSQHDSIGADSRVSVDTQLKRWRQSLVSRADPDMSSESSMKSPKRSGSVEQGSAQTGRSSTLSSRGPLRNLGRKKHSQPTPLNSDDGHSSAADSMVGKIKESRELEDQPKKNSSREAKRSRFHLSLDLKSPQSSLDDSKYPPAPLSIAELRTDASQQYRSRSLPVGEETGAVTSVETSDNFTTSNNQLASPIILNSMRKPDQKKTQRLSLPPSFQTPRARRRVKPDNRTEAQNHALQVEYSRKKETLDGLVARNSRMKSLLQIASRSVNDYDETQCIMSEKLGLGYARLPTDVLEALKHDPSMTTGHLRNLKGWRAVEDIHLRRERQKETLQAFVASLPESASPLRLPKSGIYESAIANLTDLVERLHSQRSTVLSHVRQTHELLSKVKKMRDELKPEFDEASKYTSVNYPELVRLESLLDELVNETNQLWNLGEASLSFLLTSVAPLMKIFGRPIWDELHDFLVIPLYRNGFSGETDWYPVTFPRRSISHWLRLLIFGAGTPLFLFQGAHAFFALLTHGYVLRIPAFVPAFVVYFMFSGIMCVFAFLLFGLLVAVLCELFIALWWTVWLLHIVQ